MRAAEQFGEKNAGLAEALVVALEAGEDEVEIFIFSGQRPGAGLEESGSSLKIRGRRRGCRGRRLWPGLLYGLLERVRVPWKSATTSPPCFFFQAEGFFEGETVGLVGFEADVRFANSGAAIDDGERRVSAGDLFYANSDFQDASGACGVRSVKRTVCALVYIIFSVAKIYGTRWKA